MRIYWQTKIWALLHDPVLKALYPTNKMGEEGLWAELQCMKGWISPKRKSEYPNSNLSEHTNSNLSREFLKYINLCDLIASASDRSSIGRLPAYLSYIEYSTDKGIDIHHLLSGEVCNIKLTEYEQNLTSNRTKWLIEQQKQAIAFVKDWDDPKKVYWWLWRCYTEQIGQNLNAPIISLLPAETRLPDGSLWSHTTITSALAGALAGYYQDENYPQKGKSFTRSHPHLAIFSFSPVQDAIKSSRKMRDFWAGSWLLHYLAAKVCYAIAAKYGPDIFLYPCLYNQPLIDLWLKQNYPDLGLKQPSLNKLLTAGFPNVLVMILPNNGDKNNKFITGVMTFAKETLKNEWKTIGRLTLKFLQNHKQWQEINPNTWDNWLDHQWEIYWSATPIGNLNEDLAKSPNKKEDYAPWKEQQNKFTTLKENLFPESEQDFFNQIYRLTEEEENKEEETLNPEEKKIKYRRPPNINVGSWWPYFFDHLRFGLTSVKNHREWQLPTAFSVRSSISGLGSAVHNNDDDWATESELNKFWQKSIGLFDGTEKLNATEVVKRCLHHILPELLGVEKGKLEFYYPDLTCGVAGYLKQHDHTVLRKYQENCQQIIKDFSWAEKNSRSDWGIPWIDNNQNMGEKYHPRLLNTGWLIEDYEKEETKKEETQKLRSAIAKLYPQNNPTDWYIICAGDGDSMSGWLKGDKMKNYTDYIPQELKDKIKNMPDEYKEPITKFIENKKRMSPASHNALSRALLDFSNQLVPYITEERYAGRLIYGGGDDVLAYMNLWEWDEWLWDIRQCFRGDKDPKDEFNNEGNYWRFKEVEKQPESLEKRPLFTMGKEATISFGIVIAHHSVPLAIALENLWEAEDQAKEHCYEDKEGKKKEKDAVEVRVLYSSGNILKARAKFDIFDNWKQLINMSNIEPGIFEICADLLNKHLIPKKEAIAPWVKYFCNQRSNLKDNREEFEQKLGGFMENLWEQTLEEKFNCELNNWLKIAAFVLKNREIK